MDEIYRLRTAVALSSAGSTSECRYFESTDALRVALTAAHVDALAAQRPPSREHGLRQKLARLWRRSRPAYPSMTAVLAVERHTDAGWVPVPYVVITPNVVLDITLDELGAAPGRSLVSVLTERGVTE